MLIPLFKSHSRDRRREDKYSTHPTPAMIPFWLNEQQQIIDYGWTGDALTHTGSITGGLIQLTKIGYHSNNQNHNYTKLSRTIVIGAHLMLISENNQSNYNQNVTNIEYTLSIQNIMLCSLSHCCPFVPACIIYWHLYILLAYNIEFCL